MELGEAQIKITAEDSASSVIQKVGDNLQKLSQSGQKIGAVGGAIDTLASPIYKASLAIAGAGAASAKLAIDFEDNFASVKKTVDGTPQQLDKIRQSLIDMTTKGINGHKAIPQTTAELTELAAAGGQLGIATENIASFTETMAMLGSATNLSGEEGAATLARIANVAGVAQNQFSNMGSALVALGNNFATTEKEIADMAMNMAATGNTVGIGIQDVLAYSTTLSSLGVEAAAGGSSMSRIWMGIQQAVSGGGKDLEAFASVSKKSASEFKEQWGKDANGAFLDFITGLNQSQDQVQTLADLGFKNIRDQQALLKLAGDSGLDLLTRALGTSSTAWAENSALMDEFNQKAETTASKISVAKNNIVEAGRSIGEALLPTVATLTQEIATVAQGFAALPDSTKNGIVKTGAGVVALGVGLKTASKGMTAFGKASQAANTVYKALAPTLEPIAPMLSTIGSVATTIAAPFAVYGAVLKGISSVVQKSNKEMWDAGETSATLSENTLAEAKNTATLVEKVKELTDAEQTLTNLKRIGGGKNTDAYADATKKRADALKWLNEQYPEYFKNMDKEGTSVKTITDRILTHANSELNAKRVELEKSLNAGGGNISEIKSQQESANKEIASKQKLIDSYTTLTSAAHDFSTELKNGANYDDIYKKYYDMYKDEADLYKIMTGNDFFGTVAKKGEDSVTKSLSKNINTYSEELAKFQGQANETTESLNGYRESLKNYIDTAGQILTADNADLLVGNIKGYVEKFGADMFDTSQLTEFARQATNAQTGFVGMTEAIKSGHIEDYLTQFSANMTDFGLSVTQTGDGIQQMLNDVDFSQFNAEQLTAITDSLNAALQSINSDIKVVNIEGKLVAVDTSAVSDVGPVPIEGEVQVDDSAPTPTLSGEIEYEADDSKAEGEDGPERDGTIKYEADDSSIPETGPDRHGTIYYDAVETSSKKATGTNWFSGGLAMVNDQNTADPRELIVDKGRAFIPEGRNVILPLSRGAKVYTASQTKRMMRALGIPGFASGKDNSEGFTTWREDWTHQTKIRAVSVTEELAKWNEALEKFKSTSKDVEDIQEQIYSATVKLRQEQNSASEEYLKNMSTLGDWAEYGDDALSAYTRMYSREMQYVTDGTILYDDAVKEMSKVGSSMYTSRTAASKSWLDHELNYNKMSQDDYRAGLNRMKQYTQEYYDNGLIDKATYLSNMQRLYEQYWDSYKTDYNRWADESALYLKEREAYEDWDAWGDSAVDYYDRVYKAELKARDSAKSVDEWNTHNAKMVDANINRYKAMGDSYDKDILEPQQKYIDQITDYYDGLISKRQEAADMDDLSQSIKDAEADMKRYSGAVTEAGKAKYKEASKQAKESKYQLQTKELEKERNRVLTKLQHQYENLEKQKTSYMKTLSSLGGSEFKSYFSNINKSLSDGGNISNMLQQVVSILANSKLGGTSYGDTIINTTSVPNMPQIEGARIALMFS